MLAMMLLMILTSTFLLTLNLFKLMFIYIEVNNKKLYPLLTSPTLHCLYIFFTLPWGGTYKEGELHYFL